MLAAAGKLPLLQACWFSNVLGWQSFGELWSIGIY